MSGAACSKSWELLLNGKCTTTTISPGRKSTAERYIVVRKGATPAWPGQKCFIGGSMGDISVIAEGVETPGSKSLLYSTIHGAGRVMSRTKAAGRKRWRKGRLIRKGGAITREQMNEWIAGMGVVFGERIRMKPRRPTNGSEEVLGLHDDALRVLHVLRPIGVAMAGPEVRDPSGISADLIFNDSVYLDIDITIY